MAAPATGDLSQLIHQKAGLLVNLAGSTLILYDYILTFDSEVQYFWGTRFSWTSLVYFLNRYLLMVSIIISTGAQLSSNTNPTFDEIAQKQFPEFMGLVQFMITDLVQGFRIYAVYSRSRGIFWFLAAFLPANWITTIVIWIDVSNKAFSQPSPAAQGSNNNALHQFINFPFHDLWTIWLPLIVYETASFALILYKAYRFLLNRKTFHQFGVAAEGGSRLVAVVYRDSLLYFAAIFALYITNCVLFAGPDPTLNGIIVNPTTVLLTLIGNRIMLNIRAEDNNVTPTTSDEIRLSTFRFGASASTTVGTGDVSLTRGAQVQASQPEVVA